MISCEIFTTATRQSHLDPLQGVSRSRLHTPTRKFQKTFTAITSHFIPANAFKDLCG